MVEQVVKGEMQVKSDVSSAQHREYVRSQAASCSNF